MRIVKKAHANIKFSVVTDVTEEGWKQACPFTIENDLDVDLLTAHRIIEGLKMYEGQYILVHDAEPDESWDYYEKEIPCLTFCAPVLGDMHDIVLARKGSMTTYCEALSTVANII